MKPTTETEYERTGTITGEDIQMGVQQGAMAHIMSILTNMYADPEMAVVREVATNALDSHRAAKQTRPVEVTTPSALRPVLTIQDWGVGMSPADVRNIYSQYGASTKRDTNDQTGMLGIGCKSPLAYCDTFTLRAAKDGQLTHVQVSRNERGGGTMTVIEAGPTSEPNGVLVSVPAPRENELTEKAAELLRFWDAGTVLLNGKPVESVWEVGLRITEDIVLIETENTYSSRVNGWLVQGGVPYPARFLNEFKAHGPVVARNMSLVARVPIGGVDFAPSREELIETDRTRARIEERMDQFMAARSGIAQREVSCARTRAEAVAAYARAGERLNLWPTGVVFQGEELPAHFDAPTGEKFWVVARPHSYGPANQHSRMRRLQLQQVANAIWVTGYDNSQFTKVNRTKLDAYASARWGIENPHRQRYILTPAHELPSTWLRDARSVPWNTIRRWRDPNAPKAARGGGRKTAGRYVVTTNPGVAEVDASEIPTDASVFFSRTAYKSILRDLPEGSTLVKVPRTREAKFRRLFPNARTIEQGREAARAQANEKMSRADKRAAILRRSRPGIQHSLSGLDASKLDDPELSELVRLARHPEHPLGRFAVADASDLMRTVARYPLLFNSAGYNSKLTDHLTIYANAVYAAREEER